MNIPEQNLDSFILDSGVWFWFFIGAYWKGVHGVRTRGLQRVPTTCPLIKIFQDVCARVIFAFLRSIFTCTCVFRVSGGYLLLQAWGPDPDPLTIFAYAQHQHHEKTREGRRWFIMMDSLRSGQSNQVMHLVFLQVIFPVSDFSLVFVLVGYSSPLVWWRGI